VNVPARIGLILVLAAAAMGAWAASVEWLAAAPGYTWEFPRDDAAHPEYKTEWWYVTGNLFPEDSPADPYEALAFQLTFFRVGLVPGPVTAPASGWAAGDLVMAHAAVADPAAGSHLFSEVLWRAAPLLGGFGSPADTTLAWCQAPAGTKGSWEITRSGAGYRLRAADDRQGFRYDLVCTPVKPRVFHGAGGFSPKSADGANGSLYFSYTRMDVRGTVTRGDKTIAVRGQSWLDREIFSSSLAVDQTGWDWFSLQLDDGRDLMLYRLRGKTAAADFELGTLVDADGVSRTLTAADWTLEPLETWKSPETDSAYPIRWRLQIPGQDIDLELEALMPNQENLSHRTGIHYWEGAVTARPFGQAGVPVGRGFIELTGYGKGSRPPV